MRPVPEFGELPPTRYTKVAGSSIAYQVVGDGPIDVIWVTSWFSHIDGRWQEPRWHRFWSHMSSWCRLILYGRRGSGFTDRGVRSLRGVEGDWQLLAATA